MSDDRSVVCEYLTVAQSRSSRRPSTYAAMLAGLRCKTTQLE